MNRLVPPVVFLVIGWTGAVALAQQDVPSGHWAYDAVQSLIREGILRGYPDGSFRGQKPVTRYEFAVALRDALQETRKRVNALRDEWRQRVLTPPPTVFTPPPPVFDALSADREKLKQIPEDTAERLQKLEEQTRILEQLLQEFGRDLQTIGEDVRRLRAEISEAQARVRSLERQLRQRARVSGTVDLIGRGAHGTDRRGFVDQNGYAFSGGLLNNAEVCHELNLQVSAEVAPSLRAEAEVVAGNYLTYLRSASQFANVRQRASGATDFLLWKAQLQVPITLFGRQGNLLLGRLENRMTPLTLWRPDADVYTLLPRYDSGYYSMDGLKFQLDTDLVSIMLYAAKHDTVNTNLLSDFMRVSAGNDAVNLFQPGNPLRQRPNRIPYGLVSSRQSVGASATVRVGNAVAVAAQFVALDAGRDIATSFGTVSGVNVWGWQAECSPSENWRLSAVYAQSDLAYRGDTRLSRDNWAFSARVQYSPDDTSSLWLGYRDFRPYFAPPGYWGRIGYWHNPTDLRGIDAGYRARIGSVAVDARTGFYSGTGKAIPPAGFGTEDKVVHLVINTQWQARPRWQIGVAYEGVFWNLNNARRFNPSLGLSASGKPRENYATLSLSYDLREDTVLRALYQSVFYDAAGVTSYSLLGSNKEQGGVVVIQLSTAF
jgi:hypothetical protein